MERKFEIVTKYQDSGIILPRRATSCSAGYDICAAEDTVVPSLLTPSLLKYINTYYDRIYDDSNKLREIQDFVRTTVKPTLVVIQLSVIWFWLMVLALLIAIIIIMKQMRAKSLVHFIIYLRAVIVLKRASGSCRAFFSSTC